MAVTTTTHRLFGYSDRDDIDIFDIDVHRVKSNDIYCNHPVLINNDLDDYFYSSKSDSDFDVNKDIVLRIDAITYIKKIEIFKLDSSDSPPANIEAIYVSTSNADSVDKVAVWTKIYPDTWTDFTHTVYDEGDATHEKVHRYATTPNPPTSILPIRWIKIVLSSGDHKISKVRVISANAYDFFTILDENDIEVPVSTSDKYYYLLQLPSGVPGTPTEAVHYKFKNISSYTLYGVEIYVLYDPLIQINSLADSVEFSKDALNWQKHHLMLNTAGYGSGVVPSGSVADFYIRLNIPEDANVADGDNIIYGVSFYVKTT